MTAIEKCRIECDAELRRQEIERGKLELERRRLKLIEDGKLGPSGNVGPDKFNVAKNVRLLPKFEESNAETFFNLFERVANIYKWPDAGRILMLQCTLTGRAQGAYSALGEPESRTYSCVKKAN